MTATEIGVYLKVYGLLPKPPSNVMVGKAMHSLQYNRIIVKDKNGIPRYGYRLIIQDDTILKQKPL